MNQNPVSKGILTINGVGIGTVTRAMVHARAQELALLAGYPTTHIRQSDYEQAKRELTGEPDIARQDAMLDLLPEAKRWDPVPGSTGHEMPEAPSEDEDQEGRSETEQLVDQGAEEADRDRMFQAVRAAAETDARET